MAISYCKYVPEDAVEVTEKRFKMESSLAHPLQNQSQIVVMGRFELSRRLSQPIVGWGQRMLHY